MPLRKASAYQNGNITLHRYDLAGRQTSVTRAYGTSSAATTTYTYDDAGRKTGEKDALSHTTTYSYDAASRLIAIAGAKGNFAYAYDDARNRVSLTDGNSNTTQYQYDARKRLTKTIYPDATTVTNTYDGPGNLASVTDQAEQCGPVHLRRGQPVDNVVQVNSPNTNANTTVYGYDALGNPITLARRQHAHNLPELRPAERADAKTLPDGTLTETPHLRQQRQPRLGHALQRRHDHVRLRPIEPAAFALDARRDDGQLYLHAHRQIRHLNRRDGTTTYAYDNLDRLTTKATPEGTLNYTYDAAGHVARIHSSNPNGAYVAYTYDT